MVQNLYASGYSKIVDSEIEENSDTGASNYTPLSVAKRELTALGKDISVTNHPSIDLHSEPFSDQSESFVRHQKHAVKKRVNNSSHTCLSSNENDKQLSAKRESNHIKNGTSAEIEPLNQPNTLSSRSSKIILIFCVLISLLIITHVVVSVLASLNILHCPNVEQQNFIKILAYAGCGIIAAASIASGMLAFIVGKSKGQISGYRKCIRDYSNVSKNYRSEINTLERTRRSFNDNCVTTIDSMKKEAESIIENCSKIESQANEIDVAFKELSQKENYISNATEKMSQLEDFSMQLACYQKRLAEAESQLRKEEDALKERDKIILSIANTRISNKSTDLSGEASSMIRNVTERELALKRRRVDLSMILEKEKEVSRRESHVKDIEKLLKSKEAFLSAKEADMEKFLKNKETYLSAKEVALEKEISHLRAIKKHWIAKN